MSEYIKEACCFDCIHQNIMETSHEWIECFCKADDGRKHDIMRPHCTMYEKIKPKEETK